jgi:hypothetical protein
MKTKRKEPMFGETKVLLRGVLVCTVGGAVAVSFAIKAPNPIEAWLYIFGGNFACAVLTVIWSLLAGDHKAL